MTKKWAFVKERIRDLYVVQGCTLEEVREYLKNNEDFDASIRAYRLKIQEWNFKRNTARQHDGSPYKPTAKLSAARRSNLGLECKEFLPSTSDASEAVLPPETTLAVLDAVERGSASYFLEHACQTYQTLLLNRPLTFDSTSPRLSRYKPHLGEHLLFIAAKSSSAEVVKLLLECGADVGKQGCLPGNKHFAPLNAAILCNDAQTVRELIKQGAVKNGYGMAALCFAVDHAQDPTTVLELMSFDEGTALELALRRRRREYGGYRHCTATAVVRHLLEAGVRPQAPQFEHYALFYEPFQHISGWGKYLNEDEKVSLRHFINCGLPLQRRRHQPACSGKEWGATLEHELLFHTSTREIMSTLILKLDFSRRWLATNLLHVLAAGCKKEHCHYTNTDVGPAMAALIGRGAVADGKYQCDNTSPDGETVLHVFLDRAMRCAPGGLRSQELVLSELKILLGPGRANACRQEDSSFPIHVVLGNATFIRNHRAYAREIIELLLLQFPRDFCQTQAPLWQRILCHYLPITDSYRDYSDGSYFHRGMLVQSGLTPAATTVFIQAAQVVSMKKFLQSQLRMNGTTRSYEQMLEVLKAQKDMDVQRKSFPPDFVMDVLRLLPGSHRQQLVSAGFYEESPHQALGVYAESSNGSLPSYQMEQHTQPRASGDLQIPGPEQMHQGPVWQQPVQNVALSQALPNTTMNGLRMYDGFTSEMGDCRDLSYLSEL